MADARSPDPVRGLETLRWAYREALDGSLLAVSLCMLGGFVVVGAVVGPIGVEDHLRPLQRLAFWSICGGLCWPVCHALSAAILYVARHRSAVFIACSAAGGAVFFTVPCTAVTFTVAILFNPQAADALPLSTVYLNVAVLALGCSAMVHYVACQRVKLRHAAGGEVYGAEREAGDTGSRLAGAASDSHAGFFDRLPPMVGRDLVYLNVSGHYLNVVTSAGSCLVLMRMSDAVAALGALGMRVHRSYWVAHRHVEGVVRRGQRDFVRVTGGREVPVSRARVASVRMAMPPGGLELTSGRP